MLIWPDALDNAAVCLVRFAVNPAAVTAEPDPVVIVLVAAVI
ncbi:MAG: hypothetical protein WB611_31705 [Stellaceae bacterium]